MIPRYQKILFVVLVLATGAMGFGLWKLRHNAHDRMLRGEDTAPTRAPEVAPAESATLLVANDADGSLRAQEYSLPLPADNGARAHALLAKLLDLYATSDDSHPIPGGGSAILQVFLMATPESQPGQYASTFRAQNQKASREISPRQKLTAQAKDDEDGPLLAVINLSGSFVQNHPSGIQPEMLTIHSICGTLHANLPRISEVRFLVDGQQRETLAGHADLTRTYLTSDTIATTDQPAAARKKAAPKTTPKPAPKPALKKPPAPPRAPQGRVRKALS
jgi:hypothetical protein